MKIFYSSLLVTLQFAILNFGFSASSNRGSTRTSISKVSVVPSQRCALWPCSTGGALSNSASFRGGRSVAHGGQIEENR